MTEYEALKRRVQELTGKSWNTKSIKAWFQKLSEEDIPGKTLLRGEVITRKQEILDRVQRKAEECEFLSHS
jgi:hypothetical protein